MKPQVWWVLAALLTTQAGDWPAGVVRPMPEKAQVLATVNGQPITAAEIEPLLWDWHAQEVLQERVTMRLIQEEANKVGVKASVEEVQATQDELLSDLGKNLQPGQTVEDLLRQQGIDGSKLWFRIRNEVLLKKLIVRDLVADDWVRVSTITIRPTTPSGKDLTAAIQRAEEIFQKLKRGESWDDLAKAHGGGPVGWRPKSAFPDVSRAELAQVGLVKPVQTQNGIQIFRVEALGTDPKERVSLENAMFSGRRGPVLNEIRSRAKVEYSWPKK